MWQDGIWGNQVKVYDLPEQLQIIFGEFVFEAMKIRDTRHPNLSNNFIYASCLELWGIDCHHPKYTHDTCKICGIRLLKVPTTYMGTRPDNHVEEGRPW